MIYEHATPLTKPIQQLGPDAIHMLRCISKQHTGERYSYDTARVQRTPYGGPSTEIDFRNLEFLEAGHPDTYGTLVNQRSVPQALKWADRIKRSDPTLAAHTMGILLKKAVTEDTEVYWQLSTNALRSVLFPCAYTEGRRTDRVFYYDTLDLSRFDAAPLIAFTAAKEMNYGTETYG